METMFKEASFNSRLDLLDMASAMAGVGYWFYYPTTGQVSWSNQVYAIHGVTRDTFDPNLDQAVAFYHPDDRPVLEAQLQQSVEQGVGFELRLRLIRRDGTLRHIESKADCECDSAGQVVAMFGVFQDVTDTVQVRERADDAARLEEQAKLLNLAEEMAGVGTWSWDVAMDRTTWSDQVYRIHGFEPGGEPPALDGVLAQYHPHDAALLGDHVRRAISEGRDYALEARIYRPDGEERHVVARGSCRFDNNGTVVALVGTFQDVTEQVQALERAEDAARRAALAEQIGGVGHWRVEFPDRAVLLSDQMYAICGLETGAPVAVEQLMTMVHNEDRGLTQARLDGDVAGETVGQRPVIRIVRPDGDIRWVVGDTRVERAADGAASALFGTLRDVTRETLAEKALEESEARYRRLAEHSTDVIVVIAGDGTIEYVSPACATFGYAPEELTGRRTIDLVHPEDLAFAAKTVASLLTGEPIDRTVRREYRLRCKDGGYRWIEGSPNFIPGPDGSATRILTVYRDVTARRALEDELVAARAEAEQSAAVKSEFLANMSHELRTPLTSIIGFSDLLKPRLTEDEQSLHYAARIDYAAGALLTAVNDILDFSKLEAGQVEIEPRSVDVAALLENTVGLLAPQAEAKGLTLICEAAGAPAGRLMLDDTRLRQILLNLTSNAVKFTGAGTVTVSTAPAAHGQRLRFEVRDTGSGIPADRLDRLFKRFSQMDASTTRLHGGTGLGLAICKGLAEAMGGSIGVHSVLGEGSVFFFEVPMVLAADADPVSDPDALHDDNTLDGLRLLVVDDNPANRELVRLIGGSVGLEVIEADCGEAAVSTARHHPVDLILMDMRMPGMDGETAARAIQNGVGPNATTPILVFSADVISTLDGPSPFCGSIAKPLVPAALIQGLRAALEAPLEAARLAHG